MKQSTKDEIKGNMHEAKGTVKEKAGQVTNNPNLTAEGQNEKLAGKVQKELGQIEKVISERGAVTLIGGIVLCVSAESNDFRRAAISGLTFRGKEDPRVDTDYHLGVGFRGRWKVLRP